MIRAALFLLVCASGFLYGEEHKIQILLTLPRSISTAFERSMMERGDHKVFHEPWITSYFHQTGRTDVFSASPPEEIIETKNYEEVRALIYKSAEERPVFVKDMLWGIADIIIEDEALLSDPRVVITLLIRNPAASIESFFVKGSEKFSHDVLPGFVKNNYRYDQLLKLAEKIRTLRGAYPIIIEAEILCEQPEETMRSFCGRAGLDYLGSALSWASKEIMEIPEWRHLAAWHTDAAESQGFFIPPRARSQELFAKVPEQYRSQLEEIYWDQLPYYMKLKSICFN